jgi:hypothetical protein
VNAGLRGLRSFHFIIADEDVLSIIFHYDDRHDGRVVGCCERREMYLGYKRRELEVEFIGREVRRTNHTFWKMIKDCRACLSEQLYIL